MNMTIDKKKIQYVIGIDFGHGETSAAYCQINREKTEASAGDAKDYEFSGGSKKIPSAILFVDDWDVRIGNDSFYGGKKAHVGFKCIPKSIDGEAELLMMHYMEGVYNYILSENVGMLTPTNHLVYIATPSGWNTQTKNLYCQMARKAGLPVPDNGVLSESRAAFIHAQRNENSHIGQTLMKGTIVFDLGSSTLDFTYTQNLESTPNDKGYPCGASRIDQLILDKAINDNEILRRFLHKYPEMKDTLLFEARKVKEQLCNKEDHKGTYPVSFENLIADEDFEGESFNFRFKTGDFDKLLKDSGYIQEIESAMLDYKNKYIPGKPIYGVFMTGGASRMDFVKSLVTKCWNVPEEYVQRDTDPSLSISEGLAEAAWIELVHAEGTWEDEYDRESKTIYDVFVSELSEQLRLLTVNHFADIFESFRDSSEDVSLDELQDQLSEKLAESASLVNVTSCAENAFEICHQNIHSKLEQKIYATSRQRIDLSNVKIPKMTFPNIEAIEIDDIFEELAELLAEDKKIFSGVLGRAESLFWFTMTPREISAKKLDSEWRGRAFNVFYEKWNTIKKRIADGSQNAILANKDIKAILQNAIRQRKEEYNTAVKKCLVILN